MRKVHCTVLFKQWENGYDLISINIKYKYNSSVDLIRYKTEFFNNFNNMYDYILTLLKNNNMYVHTWQEFNSTFYDIDFLDINNFSINRYPHYKIVS